MSGRGIFQQKFNFISFGNKNKEMTWNLVKKSSHIFIQAEPFITVQDNNQIEVLKPKLSKD